MITLRNIQALLWRNQLADRPVVVVDMDSDAADRRRLAQLGPEAVQALFDRIPDFEAGALDGAPPAFLAELCLRLNRRLYVVAPVCGSAGARFWFAAVDPFFASMTAKVATAFQNEVIDRPGVGAADIARGLDQILQHCDLSAIDISTRAMVTTAQKRDIPWFRIHQTVPDVQFGQGHKLRRIRETVGSAESLLGARYAGNKALSGALLQEAGLPVGRMAAASSPEQAVSMANAIGYPVVLKPAESGKGKGVIVGLATAEAVDEAARTLFQSTRQIVVQSYIPGADHRLLVVAGRIVAVARREPAAVTGNGVQTIARLIESANLDPRRGVAFTRPMNRIEVDDELMRVLALQGLNLESVPAAGAKVRLRLTANISTGGTAVDLTDVTHPDNAWLAVRAASVIGLTVVGVDFLTPDISRSWREVGGGICEINSGVGLRPHWLADPDRDVVGPILDTIYPPGEDGRIPTALITGSNGKTTTTRMLDHILRAAGHVVGSATTEGVTINGREVLEGDVAGWTGANVVLRDPSVTAAALETARGGVLKSGIALDWCNVAALLNVEHEQVGIDGIETVDDMARLKRKVVETARDAVVLNAEDRRCLSMAADFPPERTILFSLDPGAPSLADHLAAGGTVVTLTDRDGRETVVIRSAGGEQAMLAAAEIPASFGGKVRHNVANALAAAALAHGMGVAPEVIAAGLAGFTASLEHSSGRFNLIEDLPARVVFELAANPHALRHSVQALRHFTTPGRRICLLTSAGNRPDHQIAENSTVVADDFDYFICYERVWLRRGREPGEVARRLAEALVAAGVPETRVTACPTEEDALVVAANMAAPDDFLIVLGAEPRTDLPTLRTAFERKAAPVASGQALGAPGA